MSNACPRCGMPGTTIRGRRKPRVTRDGHLQREKDRRVCVPCGRSYGVVWTDFAETRTVGGSGCPAVTVKCLCVVGSPEGECPLHGGVRA